MEVISIALLTLVAAAIGTLTGFGMSTLMIPVLLFRFPPMETIFLVAILHGFGNLWKVTLFRKGFDAKLVVLFGVTGLVTSYVGALVSVRAESTMLLRLLGSFLTAYAVFLILKSRFRVRAGNGTAVAGGALSGLFAGMFGIGGAIRGSFLSAFDLPKAVYVATAGAIGVMVDATRILAYLMGGATLTGKLWWGLLLFIPMSFVGARIARNIVDRIPQERFRIVIAVFLLAMGVKLMLVP